MKRNRVYLPQSLPLPFSAEQLDPLPRLIAILESSFDGIFVTDAQARPIWCNHSYEVISGLTAQEVLGVPMGELVRRGTISHSATLEALAQGQAVTINQTFTTGKRAVVTSTPIYDQTDQICLVVTNVRDISELIALQETLDHQRRLSARYQQEIAVIRDQLLHTPQLVAEDPATLNLLRIVGRAAQLDTVVLIQGETGTGKERIASYIHQNSPRARKNFIRVNCGAIPESLAESELFGYERGAFTGANREGKPGLFEVAHEGTIFLDEVGELSLATQTKLLRVLQEKEITRVGGSKPIPIDVRVIAATNRDLMAMTKNGSFAVERFEGHNYSGRGLMDYCDERARRGYFAPEGSAARRSGQDFLWYLWCGKLSPLFGRSAMTTFERLYIADPATHEEVKDPYYTWYNEEAACRRILAEFGLPGTSHIVNGHVPVREKSGESPIKGGGRLVVIDGGFCRAYHEKTGIAGYTLVYSSRTMSLRTHQPFVSAEKAVNENIDIVSQKNILETENHRILVEETDEGETLRERVHDLKQLVKAYQLGWIKETCSEDCVW